MFKIWRYTDQIYIIYIPQKKARKVTKKWNWPFLTSQPLKISNINTGHKFKMVWNRRYNLQTRIVQFTDQKKTAKKITKNWNWPFLISQLLKSPIPTLAINLRWSETRGIIYRPGLYNLQTRKSLNSHK